VVAELLLDLVGHAADRHDGQAGAIEHQCRADHDADQDVRLVDGQAEGAGLGAERGFHGGAERTNCAVAASTAARSRCLGDRLGGVADRVQPGQYLGALAVHVAGHLRHAERVVETGPKVSIDAITPTMVSSPASASATAVITPHKSAKVLNGGSPVRVSLGGRWLRA